MELVPILSTIILVGTIATFILAVFAYILYKARERKSREHAEERRYETQRQQPMLSQQPQRAALPGTLSAQPSSAQMYIAPTTTLPPQGPIVEVSETVEAHAPSQGWGQPSLEHAQAAPQQQQARVGDGHGRQQPPRLAAPRYEDAAPRLEQRPVQQQQQPSSLFWEYTDEGFVPVDPRQQQAQPVPARPAPRTEAPPRRQESQDDSVAWL